MIKKTNPMMFRINKANKRRALSSWFADKNKYSEFLIEDYKIRTFIENYAVCKGILDDILIKRNGSRTQIAIKVSQLGPVIGKQGSEIEIIRSSLKKIVKSNNVHVEVEEVKNPGLSAKLIASSIAKQISKRIRAASAMREAEREVMRAGALGFKVIISGRHGGTDIARIEKRKCGSVPTQTIRQNIKYAVAEAPTVYGVLGVKVWIALGEFGKDGQDESMNIVPESSNRNYSGKRGKGKGKLKERGV
ncbi:MAG: 30S ribosomal protein S3 [Chlamydiia bacterium]|nr:30S ribosomal protein S3 [Chlamydiia bacterium]